MVGLAIRPTIFIHSFVDFGASLVEWYAAAQNIFLMATLMHLSNIGRIIGSDPFFLYELSANPHYNKLTNVYSVA